MAPRHPAPAPIRTTHPHALCVPLCPFQVLAEGDRIKVMVLSQDRERGRVALCTKKLEPTPGDMLRDPALVYEKAEEMAALFKQRVAAAEAAARAESEAAESAAAGTTA